MKRPFNLMCALAASVLSTTLSLLCQTAHDTPPTQPTIAQGNPAIEILSFKIGSDYYPLLDSKPSTISADNAEVPLSDAERAARSSAAANRRNNSNISGATSEEKRSRGRLRSTIHVIDTTEWVNLTVRNTGPKRSRRLLGISLFPAARGDRRSCATLSAAKSKSTLLARRR